MPKKSSFIDFKSVKGALTMKNLLEHYGLLDKFKQNGDSLSGPCPIHKGSNPTQFRVSISKNIWNCFSECKHGGNTLDFIAEMENTTIHAAALKAIEWFKLDRESMSATSDQEADTSDEPVSAKTASRPKSPTHQTSAADANVPNKPLKFKLDKLEYGHSYLTERGLNQETIVDFGVGYCQKGMMAERIAIPIHNPSGEIVAYAGRFCGEPAGDIPKYKLPPGFRKSQELFNLDRASKESPTEPLAIVEGFFDCMKIHQHGYRKVVALMGSTLSVAQEKLIREQTTRGSRVIVMLDEDEAGRAGREDIALRLSRFAFVKVHAFAKENQQPEQMTAGEVAEVLGGVQ